MKKKTLVIGASENKSRYSNLATNNLANKGHEVVAIGKREGKINDVEIKVGEIPYKNIDTVTLYLNPDNQKQYYNYILSLQPKRVIFNPGTENPEFEKKLTDSGVEVQEACTLVMLSTGQY